MPEGVKQPSLEFSRVNGPWCPIPPDFLLGLVRSTHFMRLSLQKAAHAAIGGAAYRKSGSERALCARCGIPLCSTCHLSALVDTQVSMHPWGRTVEVRVSHPLQRAQRMGHPGFVGKEKPSGEVSSHLLGHPSGLESVARLGYVSDQIPGATSPPLQAERTPLRPLRPERAPAIRGR
jgi:hypothetical protein